VFKQVLNTDRQTDRNERVEMAEMRKNNWLDTQEYGCQSKKVKLSRYIPWRHKGGEEV
jgi:hypothetical protein